MAVKPATPSRFGPLTLALAIVLVQVLAAWILGRAADLRVHLLLALLAIGLAMGLNLVRFVLWGYAHRRYPLSQLYPLTALFFPCILAIAWLQGEAFTAPQLAGTALITLGVIVMSVNSASQGSGDA